MKEPTPAPFYACIYPGLCEIARKYGYALTIHGTVSRDLDLVAIPWVDDAAAPEELVKALLDHTSACLLPGMFNVNVPEEIQGIVYREATVKPHGRLAWNLYWYAGCQIDLSVMPRQISSK